MISKAETMAKILYITVIFFEKRKRGWSFRNMRNLTRHIYIKNLKSCPDSDIPMLNSYVIVISQKRDMMIVSADKHNVELVS